jgi:hypothetical protein
MFVILFIYFNETFFFSSRLAVSIDKPSTNEIRLPLRHINNKSSSPPPRLPSPPPPPPQLNQDTLKTLLKEHLTSLLTHGASTINTNRSFVHIPNERLTTKTDELISTQQIKTNQTSPLIFHQRSTLGLTVTPVDLSSQKNLQSISIEKIAQQRNLTADSDSSSTLSNSRPATQPGRRKFEIVFFN